MNKNEDEEKTWYKDAIIYEVHIRSFYDSNADGIGDIAGLIKKLEYIEFLGVTLLWLLPFYPSPLKDDGYDISAFTEVNPEYGTLHDFKHLLREAHKRNIKIMTELVLNHTSSQHGWFQKSRTAKPGSYWRKFYVWSDDPTVYQDARIIFKDFETSNWTWDPVAKAYYWHRFYAHQPDLNFDNPEVQKVIFKVVDFWLSLGVDGLRLDAVPYLFERENTSCENLVETHEFLKKLRKHVDDNFKNRFLLAEANQWPMDAIQYFGEDNECHMAFHFPMMPRMYTAIQMEDRFPLVDILQQTPNIPSDCQWVTFLRNHDELTLEMVTDEERDYLYRFYAEDTQMRINLGIRRRLATLMGGDIKKIKLMNGLLLSLPGAPVIYYGDEIGMGDNIYLKDRNGVRTPMQWSSHYNAGFSEANPQQLSLPIIIDPQYNYEIVNVELQKQNPQSLLWWMKKLISFRKQFKAFGRGTIEFLLPENRKILAYFRKYEEEIILVIINLSRHVQYAELNLSSYIGKTLIEVFGDTEFPLITENPYFFTIGPHSFLYFKIEAVKDECEKPKGVKISSLRIKQDWTEILEKDRNVDLNYLLQNYMKKRRWFRAKSQIISWVRVVEKIVLSEGPFPVVMVFVEVEYREMPKQVYLLLITSASCSEDKKIEEKNKEAVMGYLEKNEKEKQILIEGIYMPEVCQLFLRFWTRKRYIKGINGQLIFKPTKVFRDRLKNTIEDIKPNPLHTEQSNSSIIFSDIGILKIFRKIEVGTNPDVELTEFLSQKTKFKEIARILGTLEYQQGNKMSTLCIVQEFITNQGDAWNYTIDHFMMFFEKALAKESKEPLRVPLENNLSLSTDVPKDVHELLGTYVSSAMQMGELTARLHCALSSNISDLNFRPELFSSFDEKALHQSIHSLCGRTFYLLRKKETSLEKAERIEIQKILDKQKSILDIVNQLLGKNMKGKKIRCHEDYHLGQLLYTGKDFYVIDFEGEPTKPLSERRIKHSPLKDVASMLRSYHYAIYTIVFEKIKPLTSENKQKIEQLALYCYRWTSLLFLKGYYEHMKATDLLPKKIEDINLLLKIYKLEKALHEVGYEINNRPHWLKIPCKGLLEEIESYEKE